MTAQPSSQAEREDVAREVDRLSYLLFETWKRVDPHSGVAKHPVSYIANFADMARAVIADREHATPRSMPEEVAEAYETLRRAVENVLPSGDPRAPGDRVIAFYIRMDELRALRHLAGASA